MKADHLKVYRSNSSRYVCLHRVIKEKSLINNLEFKMSYARNLKKVRSSQNSGNYISLKCDGAQMTFYQYFSALY